MTTSLAPLDHDETVRLLRSSRLARVAYNVDGEPSVVAAAVTVTTSGRMTLAVDDPDAQAHLDGCHVAVEVDGSFPSTGARWSVVARGTAVAGDDASITRDRYEMPTARWAPLPDRGQRFIVIPTEIVGHLLNHGAATDWFAGVPAS